MKLSLALAALALLAAAAGAAPPLPKWPADIPFDSLADPEVAKQAADRVEAELTMPHGEATKMLLAILRGSQLDGSDGWFGPAQSRYDFAWLAKHCGLKAGVKSVPRAEFKGDAALFELLDRDGDGAVTPADFDWSPKSPYAQQANTINRLFRRFDASGDGKLTRAELDAFFKRAADGKDVATADDFRRVLIPRGVNGYSAGDAPTVPKLVRGLFANEIGSMTEGPAVGDAAPEFALPAADGSGTVCLSELVGKKPVVIVTGNVTCGPFRSLFPDVESVARRHAKDAEFVMVYVREAHPTDGWKMDSNGQMGVELAQPTTTAGRRAACGVFRQKLAPNMTVLVDEIDDPVGTAYSGMPARLYVIDAKGKVAYKSGRGPFGFRPGEMEQALVMCRLDQPSAAAVGAASPADAAVWAKLPKATAGAGGPLPNWVAPVAEHLPRTAAAMLNLDYAHRVTSPLDAALRAKMRYVVADANRCDYAKATALFDLERAAGEDACRALVAGRESWPAEDRAPLEFARLLSVAAPQVTDAQFAGLRERYGVKQVAAMVYLAAYGNFQDRLLLGLGVQLEAGGPQPPVNVAFAEGSFQSAPLIPEQKDLPKLLGGDPARPTDPEWAGVGYDELQRRLEAQRGRAPRLPVPAWDEVKANLPAAFTAKPTRIIWTLFGYGYAPELAVPWAVCTRTMWAESGADRVFEESLFWVQTRAVECNYCMGHCEMLLQVAGLDKSAVRERTQALAGDWSRFPPAERRAYEYARKLSRTPWELTRADYARLESDLGPDKAAFAFWWLCRGLYMTRVSDGFALPLERENVFGEPPAAGKK